MRKFEQLCLDCVCSNLSLNYELCRLKKWKIPKDLGDKIYKYAYENKIPIGDEEIRIFNLDTMELTDFYSCAGRLNTSNYDFLNGHRFENLYLSSLKHFKMNLSCRIFAMNLEIDSCNLKHFSSSEMEKFFTECLHVQDSILIKGMKTSDFFTYFYHLILKSPETLKKIKVNYCILGLTDLEKLASAMAHLTNLEEFSFVSNFTIGSCGKNNPIMQPLACSCDNLKCLTLDNVTFENSTLLNILKKLRKLESLTMVCKSYAQSQLESNIFKVLIKNKLENFKELKLQELKLGDDGTKEMIDLFKYYNKFETVHLQKFSFNGARGDHLLDAIRMSCKTMKSFILNDVFEYSSNDSIKKFMKNCSSLTEMNIIAEYSPDPKILKLFDHGIESSKDTIEKLRFRSVNIQLGISPLTSINKIKTLKEFDVVKSEFGVHSMQIIKDIINSHHEKIK